MKKILLMLAIVTGLYGTANAQQTGSFDTTIMFNGESRNIAFYVPTDYDANKSYRLMVGLHGLGDNSISYRNAIISALQWNTQLPNTIFVFPDGGSDQGKDFYAPQGDEQIINESINLAKTNYNIADDDIILQGFSLGGRSALKFGLENYTQFKGLILNTPAVQGIHDLNNDSLYYSIGYKYENADKIPIALVHGAADLTYLGFDELVKKHLIMNNGIVEGEIIPKMPHTVPPIQFMKKYFDFIENPYRDGVDIDLFSLEMPQRTCDEKVIPTLLLRNTGGSESGSFILNVKVNGTDYQYTVEDNLSAYQSKLVNLDIPNLILNNGNNDFNVTLLSLSEGNDLSMINDTASNSIVRYDQTIGEPIDFGFEGNEKYIDDWFIENSGDVLSWGVDTDVHKSGNASLSKISTILLFNNLGLAENLLSPFFDLTKLENKTVSFDYAFNYDKYTPPYFSKDVIFTDTLKIYISNDCGKTYNLLFEKSGADLATAPEPILNALDIQSSIFIPTESEWKTINIDLSDYALEPSSTIKFSIVSGLGGTIYLDNIKIGEPTLSVDMPKTTSFAISPNPAKNYISIDDKEQSVNAKYTLSSINGNVIDSYKLSNNLSIDINSLESGVYFITKTVGNTRETHKFIKE